MKKKLDAEAILQKLAELRKSIPGIDEHPSRASIDGRAQPVDGIPLETDEDFEYAAVADALESMASDVQAAVDRAHAAATEKALQVYYAAEELSRDPEHANLIPHVEEMRRAYERTYGKPIPPKAKDWRPQ